MAFWVGSKVKIQQSEFNLKTKSIHNLFGIYNIYIEVGKEIHFSEFWKKYVILPVWYMHNP